MDFVGVDEGANDNKDSKRTDRADGAERDLNLDYESLSLL